jgi:hypothetical protein
MTRRNSVPKQVRHAVHDALELLEQNEWQFRAANDGASPDPLPSLLDQCGSLASQPTEREPVRLIHHFACTGGTLITKCLACSPNAHVLSEVDPLSPIDPAGIKFAPGDMLRLTEYSNRSPGMEEKISLFMASFEALYDANYSKGLRLIVRDHAHSHFCRDEQVPERPTMEEMIGRRFETLSIITVRHPLDSYLSLRNNGWVTFSPPSLEEYAKRYKAFLAAYPGVNIFKYENFLTDAEQVIQQICTDLEIPFPYEFRDLFIAHSFSGDSGRKGDVIEPRERRSVPDGLISEAQKSREFNSLCQQLNYQIEK